MTQHAVAKAHVHMDIYDVLCTPAPNRSLSRFLSLSFSLSLSFLLSLSLSISLSLSFSYTFSCFITVSSPLSRVGVRNQQTASRLPVPGYIGAWDAVKLILDVGFICPSAVLSWSSTLHRGCLLQVTSGVAERPPWRQRGSRD